MIVDANLLLFAVDERSRLHAPAREWLESAVNGPERVGLPWASLTAFLRITTHPRALETPLASSAALSYVEEWLRADNVWVPLPTDRHADILAGLVAAHDVRGNLITDADLAALAIEHGVAVFSADTDFARFSEVRWVNPIAAR